MSIIEGIGDEIIITIFAALPLITSVIICWCKGRNASLEVPDLNDSDIAERPPVYNPECPICMGPPTFALETNCGHVHCGLCFMEYFNLRFSSEALPCTLCRQRVGLLFIWFSDEDRASDDPRSSQVVSFVRSYNRLVANDISLWERLRETPILMRHMIFQLLHNDDFFSLWMRVRIISLMFIMIVYIIIPYDVVPEFAYGILGYIEDIVMAIVLIMYFAALYRGSLQR